MLLNDRPGVTSAANLSQALEAPRHGVEGTRPLLRWRAAGGGLRTLTYGEALDGIDRTRAFLAAHGVGAGGRVLLATGDEGALAVLVLACLSHGASAVVCNPEASPREAGELVSAARPVAAVVDEALNRRWPLEPVARRIEIAPLGPAKRSVLDRLLARAPGGQGAHRSDSYPACLGSFEPAPLPAEIPDGGEAYVLFTSGSTGRAKGVRISRRSLLHHARTLASVFGYDEASRALVPLPTHHTDGFLSLVLPWLCGGASVRPVRVAATAGGDLVEALRREEATHLVVVPTLLRLLLDAAGSDAPPPFGPPLRAVISTAGLLEEALWSRFEERFAVRVSNFYGLTETVTGGLFCGPDDGTYRRGTVGRTVDCEVALLGPDGAVAAEGTPGELALRGDNVMMGYLGDPEATAAVLQDGWFRTGDLATRDPEGYVRIVGRAKTTVISAGHNIQPEEVSRVLEALPAVQEAVAFGVPHETFGEVLVAAVVLKERATADGLIASCRESLAPYKVPREIEFVDSLPRGPSGKVMVPVVRERYLARRLDGGRTRAEPGAARSASDPVAPADVWAIVRETAARAFRVPAADLAPTASPDHTPGWDSFAHLELVLRLEDHFRVRLETAEVLRIRSLADAQTLVLARLAR